MDIERQGQNLKMSLSSEVRRQSFGRVLLLSGKSAIAWNFAPYADLFMGRSISKKRVRLPIFKADLRENSGPDSSFFCLRQGPSNEELGLSLGLFFRSFGLKSRSRIRVSSPSEAVRRCLGFLSRGKFGQRLVIGK
jgi:hypothetical protein